jgi:hypothetical protein
MSNPVLTSARVVALGRYGIETKTMARSWDIELSFGGGQPIRLKGGFKVRSLAVSHLASILAEARAMGVDARQPVRAACSPEPATLRPVAKCIPAAAHLQLIVGGRGR